MGGTHGVLLLLQYRRSKRAEGVRVRMSISMPSARGRKVRDGEAKLGMRVAFTARAREVPGIILKRRNPNVEGMVTMLGIKNHLGGELVRVHWDDNEVYALNVYWLRRAWCRGGYRHGRRTKLTQLIQK